MEGGGVSGQSDPDVLLSKLGADLSTQWAQAVADEAERTRERMKKDSINKAEADPSAMAMIPAGLVIVELQAPSSSGDGAKEVGAVLSAHQPVGRQSVGPKGKLDVSQNEDVFHRVGEGQLMSLITSVLTQWGESVKQTGAAQDRVDKERAQVAFNQFVDEVRQQGSAYPHYFDSHVIISTMIMATGLLGVVEGSSKVTDDFKGSFKALEQGANVTAKLVPDDMRAELGLLGAMMLASAVPYSAAWLTVSKPEKSEPGEENINKAFVKNYADRMIKLTSDENYTNYLKAIVTLHIEGTPTSETQIAQYVNMLKVGLLMTSLALFCQLETGDRPGERVASMLGGSKPIPENDPKASLLKTIKLYLDSLTLAQRVDVLSAVMEYLDSKPNVKTLMNPLATFTGLRDAGAFAESQRPTPA